MTTNERIWRSSRGGSQEERVTNKTVGKEERPRKNLRGSQIYPIRVVISKSAEGGSF